MCRLQWARFLLTTLLLNDGVVCQQQQCPVNCDNMGCDPETMECVSGCNGDFYSAFCNVTCPLGCRTRRCVQANGTCLEGCATGIQGAMCSVQCSKNCVDNICNQFTGNCTDGCIADYIGPSCTSKKRYSISVLQGIYIGVALLGIAIITMCSVIFHIYYSSQKIKPLYSFTNVRHEAGKSNAESSRPAIDKINYARPTELGRPSNEVHSLSSFIAANQKKAGQKDEETSVLFGQVCTASEVLPPPPPPSLASSEIGSVKYTPNQHFAISRSVGMFSTPSSNTGVMKNLKTASASSKLVFMPQQRFLDSAPVEQSDEAPFKTQFAVNEPMSNASEQARYQYQMRKYDSTDSLNVEQGSIITQSIASNSNVQPRPPYLSSKSADHVPINLQFRGPGIIPSATASSNVGVPPAPPPSLAGAIAEQPTPEPFQTTSYLGNYDRSSRQHPVSVVSSNVGVPATLPPSRADSIAEQPSHAPFQTTSFLRNYVSPSISSNVGLPLAPPPSLSSSIAEQHIPFQTVSFLNKLDHSRPPSSAFSSVGVPPAPPPSVANSVAEERTHTPFENVPHL